MDEPDELSEKELDGLLRQWKAPATPQRLRGSLFPESRHGWWGRFWGGSIRIPVPAACGMALVAALLAWRGIVPPQRVVVMQAPEAGAAKFQPVSALRPRIVKAADAAN
jgi:hypothetical protein